MTKRTLGQWFAPPRFIMFAAILIAVTVGAWGMAEPARAFMIGFDAAATVFLLSVIPLLRAHEADEMRRHANDNNANRAVLLVIAFVVMAAILAAVAVELSSPTGGNVPLVMGTLVVASLFGNIVYALHYAQVFYLDGSTGGLDFGGEPDCPDYSDFIYFAITIGCAFATSDTRVQTRQLRRIATGHALAAFVFNVGVVSFSISVLSG